MAEQPWKDDFSFCEIGLGQKGLIATKWTALCVFRLWIARFPWGWWCAHEVSGVMLSCDCPAGIGTSHWSVLMVRKGLGNQVRVVCMFKTSCPAAKAHQVLVQRISYFIKVTALEISWNKCVLSESAVIAKCWYLETTALKPFLLNSLSRILGLSFFFFFF